MANYKHPLDSIKIASPCPADWESMLGDHRRRFCGQCELNVYNLSDMTRREAENLIRQSEGRLCVRFFQRSDGTILTRDCPVGLKAMKRRVSRIARASLSAAIGFLSGLGLYTLVPVAAPQTTMGVMVSEVPGRKTREIQGAIVAPRYELGRAYQPVNDEPDNRSGGEK